MDITLPPFVGQLYPQSPASVLRAEGTPQDSPREGDTRDTAVVDAGEMTEVLDVS